MQFSPPTKSVIEEELKKVSEHIPARTPWRIFTFLFIIFIALLSLYGGIVFGYKPYLNSQIKNLDQKISTLTQTITEEQQAQLINFYSQVVNLENLLKSHSVTSKFFDLLERNTYQDIHYTNLSFGIKEREAKLLGTAPSYEILIKELELLRQLPEAEKVFLENSQTEELARGVKSITFVIRILLAPQFLKAS